MRLPLLGLLLGLLSLVSALSATGSKLLVILEEESEKSKYSHFWHDLESRGFQITYRSPKDTSVSLFLHNEPAYSHLLLLPTKSKGLGPNLTPNILVDFLNGGSNILLALSSEQGVPSGINSLLLELDISLPADRNSLVVDHFNYDTKSAGEKHDVLLLPSPDFSKREGTKNFFAVDGLIAIPRAVGQVLGNTSPLLASVLKAPSTAYITNPKDDADSSEDLFATGSQINLVSAFQARNSARLTVLGSSEALEDKWFGASVQISGAGKKSEKSANRAFAQRLSEWTFNEVGVLKVENIRHWLNEGTQKDVRETSTTELGNIDMNPSIYRIKNQVHYSLSLSEWTSTHWSPFLPPPGDNLQLEFSMLSPFHRLNLHPSSHQPNPSNATLFAADFKIPDRHGIFNLFVEYRRPFYNNVEVKDTVTVRHFAHDEYPRSFVISGAWPWVGGVWVTVLGWVGFVGVWLFSRPAQTKQEVKGKR